TINIKNNLALYTYLSSGLAVPQYPLLLLELLPLCLDLELALQDYQLENRKLALHFYLLCELLLLQLLEYPESEIFVLVVPDSDSITFLIFMESLKEKIYYISNIYIAM